MPKTYGERLIFVDDLEVWVIEKRIKRLNLRVVGAEPRIEVSVPRRTSDREVASFVRRQRDWIDGQIQKALESPMAQAEAASPAEIREWREAMEECVPALVAAWEPILGVKAQKLAYRNMKSRWGSCQPTTGRICINVRLALYPPECLEYVVVHELCHLLVPGHGPEFRELMTRVMPDWKQRRAKLR